MKQSTFKNVKTFLKNSAKDGLIKIKETKSDVMVTGGSVYEFIASLMPTLPRNDCSGVP